MRLRWRQKTWAEAVMTSRLIQIRSRGADLSDLRADAHSHCIAVCFINVVENVFPGLRTIGVFDGRCNAREQAKVVEGALLGVDGHEQESGSRRSLIFISFEPATGECA